MKSTSSLLRGLPLQAGDSNDNNALERKKSRFIKYFTFFTKLLSRCKEDTSLMNMQTMGGVVGAKDTIGEKKKMLGEFTIQCLSNLLAANIDSGLQV